MLSTSNHIPVLIPLVFRIFLFIIVISKSNRINVNVLWLTKGQVKLISFFIAIIIVTNLRQP